MHDNQWGKHQQHEQCGKQSTTSMRPTFSAHTGTTVGRNCTRHHVTKWLPVLKMLCFCTGNLHCAASVLTGKSKGASELLCGAAVKYVAEVQL